jgi:hypothetical protein
VLTTQGQLRAETVEIFKAYKNGLKEKNDGACPVWKETFKESLPTSQKPSLETLTQLSQKVFIRPPGAERLDPSSLEHYKKLYECIDAKERAHIFTLFEKLGDVKAVYPKHKEFDYILIHGSTIPNMRERIMTLASAINDKRVIITPNTQIVFLDGERPLFAFETKEVIENPAPYRRNTNFEPKLHELPRDEREASQYVWEQLELPQALRVKKPLFVHASKKPEASRAETEDTVKTWAQVYKPQKGLALVISNNPYVYYQVLVTETFTKKAGVPDLTFEALGSAMSQDQSEEVRFGLLLDNFSRILYYLNNSNTR